MIRERFTIDETEVARQLMEKFPALRQVSELAYITKDDYYSKLARYYILKATFESGISLFVSYLISLLSETKFFDIQFGKNNLNKFLSILHMALERPGILREFKENEEGFEKFFDIFLRMSRWFVDKFSRLPEVKKRFFKGLSSETIEVILIEYFNLLEALGGKK